MGMLAGVIGFFFGWIIATITFFGNMNWFLAVILTLTLGPAFGFIVGMIFSIGFGLTLGLTQSHLGREREADKCDYQSTIDNEPESHTNENAEKQND